MSTMFEKLAQLRIVPVITLHDAAKAAPLAKALIDGGLPCAEVTFRTAAAAEGIKNMVAAYPEILVGAGTILTPEQADKAVAAGAKFIVAPGLNPEVVRHCQKIGVPVLPGIMTPSELEQGLSLGLTHLKFFPAGAAGGAAMLRALSAPYGAVKFMPTGGVTSENLQDYLSIKSVFACGGSWMVKEDLLANDNFEEITRLTREAVAALK
ncbi:MAG: bifunctional 4-hydroxy-2-oxoglutarate aldolase/2-dehydro-3-deoxy-phosphogluconate aldolase [Defluviitaleaceae bacterium]|nr:bifunctional 4-hydroxy-2-oxoglutarate aldolase/2-dehydro-3-deoxy-phosphogluconate aldolase [Defluviitaleaceae bacterium]MCL2275265.1 bifunctional 4-hydroxy-2-oxoglutarate aldolase/2-dehydro-3-deoxy-phosphogluconate aldolase [Defluviitaleaceae bacterium]